MTKSLFFLSLVLTLAGIQLHPQSLNGVWKGELFQTPDKTFYFEIRFDKSEDYGKTSGTTYIKSYGDPSQKGSKKGEYGTLEFVGVWNGEDVILQETGIVQQNKSNFYYWCIKKSLLKLTRGKEEWKLTGHWVSTGGCMPGTLTVTKKIQTEIVRDTVKRIDPVDSLANITPIHNSEAMDTVSESKRAEKDSEETVRDTTEKRKVEIKNTLQISNSKIELKVWDNNLVDGDIIWLSLNGKWVLKHHTVTKGKKKLYLQLSEKQNLLILYAENLGSKPPNTAAIIVNDGIKDQKVILNSDKGKSEAIMINLQ